MKIQVVSPDIFTNGFASVEVRMSRNHGMFSPPELLGSEGKDNYQWSLLAPLARHYLYLLQQIISPMATMEDIPNPSPTSMNSLNSVSCKPEEIININPFDIIDKNKT